MLWDILFTTITLWLIWGLTPWPVIFIWFSEILEFPKKWLIRWWIFVLVAGVTEFFIGLFLIATSAWLKIAPLFIHFVGLWGVIMLCFLAWKISKINSIKHQQSKKDIKILHIIVLMASYWPLWLFWISVCLPIALKFWNIFPHGGYVFLAIFEISMMVWLWVLLFLFYSFRHIFSNKKVIGKVFMVLSILLLYIAMKMLYGEILFFSEFLREF